MLATRETLDLMALRLGERFTRERQIATPGEKIRLGEVNVSFHPAGHVLGSAQILIEARGFRIVVSGDYKRARDPTCEPFAPLSCDAFITEATFGLPVFRHPDASAEVARLMTSLRLFPERAHLVGAYSLGKAQRVMALIREAGWDRPIYMHRAVEKITAYYQREGAPLGDVRAIAEADRGDLAGDIVVCPPTVVGDGWADACSDPVIAIASGWMSVRAFARQRGGQLPLAISDHADWDALRTTILETGCEEVWVTHGAEAALIHWARQLGLNARTLRMAGRGEGGDEAAETPA